MTRILTQGDDSSSISMLYSDVGFTADADEYEEGLVVDDPAFGDEIDEPASEKSSSIWAYYVGGAVAVAIVLAMVYMCVKNA